MVVGKIDGAEPALDSSAYHGWQTDLLQSDAAYTRALVLVGQYVFNPLGLLSTRALVVARSDGVLAWMIIQSFFSATLITLLILAIRRRFKLKA